jgi:hypothetical protein
MANDEHVAILKKGVDAWNGWRNENPDMMLRSCSRVIALAVMLVGLPTRTGGRHDVDAGLSRHGESEN